MEHRARVYLLTADNEWSDVATGLCHTTLSPSAFILSISPDSDPETDHTSDSNILYSLSIGPNTELSVQQETVVAWTREEDGVDVAVSFETQTGCESVWAEMCRFQGRFGVAVESGNGASQEGAWRQLPSVVEQSTLTEIEAVLGQACQVPFVRRNLAGHLVDAHYIEQLVQVFKEAEQKDSSESLRLLFGIFRSLVLLNSSALLKEMLSEELVLDVAGVFEYEEQDVPAESRPKYREYLSDASRYKQVVPVKSSHLLALIHETFRAQYFKDVVLPRVLDDDTFTTLVMLIRSNHLEIITGLEEEGEVYGQLYIVLSLIPRGPFLKTENRQLALQVLRFFKEFLTIARSSTNPSQLRLYQYIVSSHNTRDDSLGKFMAFLESTLANTSYSSPIDRECREIAVELLLQICQHDPQILRQVMLDNRKASSGKGGILLTLIDCFLNEAEFGVRWQLVHLIRTVVDTASALNSPALAFTPASSAVTPVNTRLMDDMLNAFYPWYATRLLQPFIDLDKFNFVKTDATRDDILFHLCDLLTFFITAHKFRIKYLLLRSFIIQNALLLLQKHPNSVMKAAALRVFRTMIGTNDDFYYRFFVKHSSFRPILALFRQNDGRNNLIESALFELFEAIRATQSRILINHLVEQHGKELQSLNNSLLDRLTDVYLKLNPQPSNTSVRNAAHAEDDYFERLDGGADDIDDNTASGQQEEILHPARPYSPSKRSKLE